ncbi:MAG: hypothetical protein H0X26_06190 [Alphaproteobacteria bacterium]|nr:hypothetical protein [Alphaproteobacteria bacterium]
MARFLVIAAGKGLDKRLYTASMMKVMMLSPRLERALLLLLKPKNS